MTPTASPSPGIHSAPAAVAGARARAPRGRVRRSLHGPDLLATAVEDSCTWYGYLAILLCHVDDADDEDAPAGR